MSVRILISALMALWLATGVGAQTGPGALIADRVTSDANVLRAEGNVTLFQGGTRITATRVTYDQRSNKLVIKGPMTVRTANGDIIEAAHAELSPEIKAGVVNSVRAVLNKRLQIVAANAVHKDPVTSLQQVAATACTVCPGRAPLWEIRSRELIHDSAARRIWIQWGHLRIKGVPVMILPPMSLPEPGVARARGLLRPTISSMGGGTVLKLPYFIPIGDDKDVTVTPWITANIRAAGLRYRQALSRGTVTIDSIIARGAKAPHAQGIWARASLNLSLPAQWRMYGDLEVTSNRSFLRDLGIDGRGHLDSAIHVSRIMPRHMVSGTLTHYAALRDEPHMYIQPVWHARTTVKARRPFAGGFVYGGLELDGYLRDLDKAPKGQVSMTRNTATLGWRGGWIAPVGVKIDADLAYKLDHYWVDRAGMAAQTGLRHQRMAAVSAALPLRARSQSATHILTPRVTTTWSDLRGITPPAEDRTPPEWDSASLHRFTRIPGEDSPETGLRTAASLRWDRIGASGRATWLSLGRLTHHAAPGTPARRSDWVLALGTQPQSGLRVNTNLLLSDTGTVQRAETRALWSGSRANMWITHAFAQKDPGNGRATPASELRMGGGWQITPTLHVTPNARINLADREAHSAGLAFDWRHDCVRMKLSASHKFRTSSNVTPKTDFGFEISVDGFTTGSGVAPARSCRN